MLRTIVAIIIVAGMIACIYLPIDIPYRFNSVAKVYPARQWILQKNPDGSLVSSMKDYRTGMMKDYASFQFDRGDVVQIRFNPAQLTEMPIDSGALIAEIYSNTLQEQLVSLRNQLVVQQAQLASDQTGQKPEILAKRQEENRLAQQALIYAEQQEQRAQEMLEEGLIAQADYEIMENNLRLAKTRVELAEKNLLVSDTGQKPEDIQLTQARISALQQEIIFLENKSGFYQLYAPLSGNIRYESDRSGDRMIIEDTSSYVLLIPVRLKDRFFLDQQSSIDVQLVGRDSVIRADLLDVGRKTEQINNTVVVMAKAEVEGAVREIGIGMPVQCQVSCGEVRLLEYLKRSTKVEIK